jgi:hypothetical protein
MWHPTSTVTRAFREYVLLAPQLVHQDWLAACRLSAPHSSVDTGTPHRRFAGFSICPGRADCPLFSAVAIPRLSRPYSLVLVAIPLLLLQSLSSCCCSLSAVRYTARCYSWRLAASAVSLVLLVMRSPLRPCCSHCWTVPFCHSVVSLWVRHGLTVHCLGLCVPRVTSVNCPSSRCSSSLVVLHGGLSYSSCPGNRRRFALADCPGAVAPGWLFSHIIVAASAGSLLGCPLFTCTVHHLFCDRLGVPTGSRCPGFACFRRGSVYSVFGGGSPRVVSRTLISSF